VADDVLAYLTSLSEHPSRPGDVSNMNPDFASRLAAAIKQARDAGLPVGVMSGYRGDTTTGSAYDAGGNSSHGYGLASDISGLDGPNGKITNAWAQIASANGLHNPYGVGNKAEFNHWQLPEQPLEKTPALLASLKDARSSGDFQNVWKAYGANAGGGSSPTIAGAPAPINPGLTVNTSPMAGSHAQYIQDYAKSIGLDPSLALGIANAEGLKSWSAANPNAASTVDVENGKPFSFGDFQLNVRNGMGNQAIAAGIDPRDPNQWQAADKFALDQMKAGGVGPWKGDPVAAAYLKSGAAPNVAPAAPAAAAATPATPAGVLPGFGDKASSDNFTQGAKALDKAVRGDQGGQEGGQGAAFNFPQARNVSPLLGMSSQVYGNTLNSMATPMQWSSATPGQSPYANAGGPAPLGTGLNSLAQLQQMMAMYGGAGADPYGGGYG
jgi:hypothetical protein